jgi:hypothetical protein
MRDKNIGPLPRVVARGSSKRPRGVLAGMLVMAGLSMDSVAMQATQDPVAGGQERPGGRIDARVRAEGNTLHYEGLITSAGLSKFAETLQQHPEVITLQVRSRGGDALPAIEMGEHVLRRNLAVVVDRVCNSACANYLFVPAATRRVLPGSVVMWHNSCPQNIPEGTAFERVLAGEGTNLSSSLRREGVPLSETERERVLREQGPELAEKLRRYFRAVVRPQRRLFASTGIDSRIVCLGDYLQLPHGGDYAYTLSATDMAAFGLCGVQLPGDYEEGVARILAEEGLADRAGALRLNDYPEFKPSPRRACPMRAGLTKEPH